MQDRAGKVAYLQKIFDAVSITLQQSVPADPSQVYQGNDFQHYKGSMAHIPSATCSSLLFLINTSPLFNLVQVVAGQEPEKTNKFLQMLGQAALKGKIPERTALSANTPAQASIPESRLQSKPDQSSISDTPKVAGHGPPKRRNRANLHSAPNQAHQAPSSYCIPACTTSKFFKVHSMHDGAVAICSM